MYIGDRIDNDVIGSSSVGMTPVLINAYTNQNKTAPPGVTKIERISQLPDVIAEINPRFLPI